MGRAEAGFGDLQTLSQQDLDNTDTTIVDAFFVQNLSRAAEYVQRPDTTGAIIGQAQASQNLASRGASWALLRYAADWFSGGDPHTLTRALVAGPDTGVANLTKQTNASSSIHYTGSLARDVVLHRPGLNATLHSQSSQKAVQLQELHVPGARRHTGRKWVSPSEPPRGRYERGDHRDSAVIRRLIF